MNRREWLAQEFEHHRPHLRGVAYRMLGSISEAGSGSIRFAGRELQIGEPRIVDREVAAAFMPPLLRFLAGRLGLRQYVLVRRVSS